MSSRYKCSLNSLLFCSDCQSSEIQIRTQRFFKKLTIIIFFQEVFFLFSLPSLLISIYNESTLAPCIIEGNKTLSSYLTFSSSWLSFPFTAKPLKELSLLTHFLFDSQATVVVLSCLPTKLFPPDSPVTQILDTFDLLIRILLSIHFLLSKCSFLRACYIFSDTSCSSSGFQ